MGILQIVLFALAAYIGIYAIVDRICRCIENKAVSDAYISLVESGCKEDSEDEKESDTSAKTKNPYEK